MSYLDELTEKKRIAQQAKAERSTHNESLSAVNGSAQSIAKAVKTEAEASRNHTQPVKVSNDNLAEKQDIDKVIQELKEVQLATLLSASNRPEMNLTVHNDLNDKLQELGNRITNAISGLDTSLTSAEQLTALKSLKNGVQELTGAIKASHTDTKSQTATIIEALNGLEMNPVINTPAVKIPPVDFSPLQTAIRELKPEATETRFDLSRYKAVDIKDSDDKQYVGFVNPEGNWYIIENRIRENSMRFVFGASGYSTHFKNAAQYQYKLLDKAITSATV